MKKKQTKPVVAITGATGFLGTILVDHFVNKGWRVVALARNLDKINNSKVEYREYNITNPISSSALDDVDYLIHTAYIKMDTHNPDALDMNINGAKRILHAAKKSNVKQLVFISTMSAHEDAISIYGKQKLAIESLFLETKNSTVLRSGLIIGNGGIVKDMAKFMKSKHAVPLIGGGKQPLQIISVYDLALVIEKVLMKSHLGRFIAATPEVYTYKQFYTALAKYINTKVAFIPIPYWTLEALFKIAAAVRLNLGVGEDNLKGLKKLITMPSSADMEKIGVKPINLENALKKSRLKG